jgi:DnaJ-class molecular chaperone
MKDYYKVLGLKKTCEFIDVINSYNKSIKYFNSKKTLNDDDKETIKEIKESYFILGNYHNRRKYDNNLEGYKKINDDYSDRIFYRPDLKYQHNADNKIRNAESDRLNNKKNRMEHKEYNRWE